MSQSVHTPKGFEYVPSLHKQLPLVRFLSLLQDLQLESKPPSQVLLQFYKLNIE